MVAAGVPLSFVAQVAGHSTLSCAARYGKLAPTDAGVLAIRALGGDSGRLPVFLAISGGFRCVGHGPRGRGSTPDGGSPEGVRGA